MAEKRRQATRFLPNFEACSVALFAACAIGASMGVHAQTPIRPGGRVGEAAFARADTNKDGRLSREEAVRLPAISERFDQIDTDHDGFISPMEFEEALKH